MKHLLLVLLTFFSVCAIAQTPEVCGYEEKGNLISRQGVNGMGTESFTYDEFDRLIEVSNGDGTLSSETEYEDNGNISYKHEAGSYLYHSLKPHAVEQVDNSLQSISTETQQTAYNAHGKIAYIEEGGNTLTFFYGPDNQRWQTTLMTDGAIGKTLRFLGDYEVVDSGGVQREYWYVADGVVLYRESPSGSIPTGAPTPLYALQDHLGSYLRLYTDDGTEVFSAEYDAWGRQTARHIAMASLPSSLSAFAFHRGYTGHEMLPAFGLINMNGRLYDPAIARFLSPDNYVQLPDNAQNFNRYSYCLNNPLKYVDPSGEAFWLVAALIGGVVNLISNAFAGKIHNFWQGVSSFVSGAAVGGLSAYAGGFVAAHYQAVGVWAGMQNGAISGGIIGGATSAISTTLDNIISGNSLSKGLLGSVLFGIGSGTILGGIQGGINGAKMAREFGLDPYKVPKEWRFGYPEKVVRFNFKSIPSSNPEDCIPQTYTEIEAYLGGNRDYDYFKNNTGYKFNKGVNTSPSSMKTMTLKYFPNTQCLDLRDGFKIFEYEFVKNIYDDGGIISLNIANNVTKTGHFGNVRSLLVYSDTKKTGIVLSNNIIFSGPRNNYHNYIRNIFINR